VSRTLFTFLLILFWAGVSHAQTLPSVIPAGQVYELAGTASVENLTIDGTLRISRTQASRLEIGCNLIVAAGGVLDMGTDVDPVLVDHDLVFDLNNAEASGFVGGGHFQATDCGLWVDGGTLLVHGRDVLRTWGKLSGDLAAGATTVTVDGDVSRWPVGGQIVVTQTSFPWYYTYAASGAPVFQGRNYETETRTIAAVDGNTLTLAAPLSFAHRGSGLERGEVGLLSHNIRIRTELSENTANLTTTLSARKFAHVMVMHCGTAQVQFAAFEHMGHIGTTGRYALHFHELGACGYGTNLVRGVSFVEAGNRATNLHESNGILVEDTVALLPGCVGHYIQTNPNSVQADVAYIHNLVAAVQSGGVCGIGTGVAFWLGTTDREAHIGNVSAGFPPDGYVSLGFYWATGTVAEPTGRGAGQFPIRLNLDNEAHSHRSSAFKSWQNIGLSTNDDVVGSHAWATRGEGIFHGAYANPLRWYNARLVENFGGYVGLSVFGYLQDSVVQGRGPSGVLRADPDDAVVVGAYVVAPNASHPWRVVRTSIANLTPSASGQLGRGVFQSHATCPTPATALLPVTSACSPTVIRVLGNTFGPGLKPYEFGWTPNVNSHWTRDGDVLLRADQNPPTGVIAPVLFNASTRYDAAADALSTPIGSLPPTLTWSGWTFGNQTFTPYVLTPAYDPPPTMAVTTTRTGSVVQMAATVSPDVVRAECFRNHVALGARTAAPWTWTVDLADATGDPLPAQRYHTLHCRAFDGVVIDQGGGPVGSSDPLLAGYTQRAYAPSVAFGPEVFADVVTPPVDPTITELQQQIVVLEQQIQALAGQNATLTDARNAAQQTAEQVGSELSQAILQIQRLQAAIVAAKATLAEVP